MVTFKPAFMTIEYWVHENDKFFTSSDLKLSLFKRDFMFSFFSFFPFFFGFEKNIRLSVLNSLSKSVVCVFKWLYNVHKYKIYQICRKTDGLVNLNSYSHCKFHIFSLNDVILCVYIYMFIKSMFSQTYLSFEIKIFLNFK